MKPGTKKTPTNLKLITGNPGKRPLNKSEAVVEFTLPKTPSELDARANKIWKERGARLVKLKLMSEIDDGIFMGYCQLMSWCLQLMRDVKKEGLFIQEEQFWKDGEVIIKTVKNPKLLEARLMFDKIRLMSAELGMSPSARSGIVIPKTDEEDEMAKYNEQLKAQRKNA